MRQEPSGPFDQFNSHETKLLNELLREGLLEANGPFVRQTNKGFKYMMALLAIYNVAEALGVDKLDMGDPPR
jgi:hypothetical protein